jgi:multidrug efflux pump subunit AcrA (membrane-fusion protein)
MKSWIFIGILIALLSGGVYYYYTTTQTRIEALTQANATLVVNNGQLLQANSENLDTIDELQNLHEENRQNYTQLENEFQVIRMENHELREKLGRHELDALAAARPTLVERTVNRASENAMRCFEILSGSPLTEREINARNSREANPECPWLFESVD